MSSSRVEATQTVATNLKVDASGVAVPVTDNGGSLTVDGAVTVSGTATVSGTVTANAGTGTLAVSLAVLPALVAGSAVIGVVIDQSPPTTANGQVNVSNSAATLVAQRLTRKQLTIVNRQVAPIFVGIATVSTANGFQIDPGGSLTLYTTALIQAITAAASGATEKTHYIETY